MFLRKICKLDNTWYYFFYNYLILISSPYLRYFCIKIESKLDKILNKALTYHFNFPNQSNQSESNNVFQSKSDRHFERNIESNYDEFSNKSNENSMLTNNINFIDNNYSLKKLEKFISDLKENKFKKVSFLLGAGISTAAGIPDFRSKDGLYEKIKGKFDLEKPTDLFHIRYFWQNPIVYYTYLKTVIGKIHNPTRSHVSLFFLSRKKFFLIYINRLSFLPIFLNNFFYFFI